MDDTRTAIMKMQPIAAKQYLSQGLKKKIEIYTVHRGNTDSCLLKFSLGCPSPRKFYVTGRFQIFFLGII
jgi:hypothetical protein